MTLVFGWCRKSKLFFRDLSHRKRLRTRHAQGENNWTRDHIKKKIQSIFLLISTRPKISRPSMPLFICHVSELGLRPTYWVHVDLPSSRVPGRTSLVFLNGKQVIYVEECKRRETVVKRTFCEAAVITDGGTFLDSTPRGSWEGRGWMNGLKIFRKCKNQDHLIIYLIPVMERSWKGSRGPLERPMNEWRPTSTRCNA